MDFDNTGLLITFDDDFVVAQSPNVFADSVRDPSLSGCSFGPDGVTEDVLHLPVFSDQDFG